MEYDFKSLSDYDFELLCQDLLGKLLGIPLEGFRQGRDRGIDLRYAKSPAGELVVQCKHYARTPFSGLKQAVAAEVPKLARLRPARYLLATSRFLTPAEKDTLYQLLQPYCVSPGDILGGNELNALLRQYPEVERSHYKLWLTSTAVLDQVLNNGSLQSSAFHREFLQQRLRLYVQSRTAYSKAMEMLSRHHCCIISGIPGIGKTTLAQILTIHYLAKGYQLVKVRSDIREALDAYRAGVKQVFFYDDFLGSTALELKQNKNEGSELLEFLSSLSRKSGKVLILTTREYLLHRAQQEYESFARQDFDYNRCILSLEDYTRSDRAHILYNHLYFYQAPQAWVEDLLRERRVLKLIDHPNYNPRLIETVTTMFSAQEQSGFYDFFLDTLDHPGQLWENAFRRQLSPTGRDLVLLMGTCRHGALKNKLQQACLPYHQRKAREENRALGSDDFMDALQETEGTFLKIDRDRISFHNPSIQDFVTDYLEQHPREFTFLCEEFTDFQQCIGLGELLGEWSPASRNAVRKPFLEAVQRLCMMGLDEVRCIRGEDTAGKRALQLISLSRKLGFPELKELAGRLALELAAGLAREEALLDRDGDVWHDLDAPGKLAELLNTLCVLEDTIFQPVWSRAVQYMRKWFSCAFLYSMDDFLALEQAAQYGTVSIEDPGFCRVREAFQDYLESVFPEEVRDIDYEDEGLQYLTDLETLEAFFGVELSYEKELVDDRLWELEETAEDEDYDVDIGGNRSEEVNILDLFESLRNREPGGGIS